MSSKTVKDLVPGDPDEIWQLADSYTRIAQTCEEAGYGFRTIDDGGWSGRAAEAFHTRFERQPKLFLSVADCYYQVAVALDNYAATLAWAQRQAGEVIALGDEEPMPAGPRRTPGLALSATEQAELTGLITGADEPEPIRVDQRALALSDHDRALDLVERVGNESAAEIISAAASMFSLAPLPPDVSPPSPPSQSSVASTSAIDLVAVLPQPARTGFDPVVLRNDRQAWDAAIKESRKRLGWDGLNRLSPRLVQHVFEGHYRPGKRKDTGYHHRNDGVDHGELHLIKILEGPDLHGVYRAQWRGPRTPPGRFKVSTFFPDSWSPATVLYAIRHAFLHAMQHKANFDRNRRSFRGIYQGVQIEGRLKAGSDKPYLCDIVTAYPHSVRTGWSSS